MSAHICGWAIVCDDWNCRIESGESSVKSGESSIRSDWATTEEYWTTAPDPVRESNRVRSSNKIMRIDVLSRATPVTEYWATAPDPVRESNRVRSSNKIVRIDILSRNWRGGLSRATPVTDFADDTVLVSRTNEHVMVMEEILPPPPPILRKRGAFDAKDGDSIDILDGVYFMGLVCNLITE